MKCKRAKLDMALCAGQDLDRAAEQDLRRHLAACPGCRDQWQRIQSTTRLLQEAGADESAPAPAGSASLWSQVSQALEASESKSRPVSRTRWTDAWVPVVAVASLMLAIVSITQSLTRPSSDDSLGTVAAPAGYVDPNVSNVRLGGEDFATDQQSPEDRRRFTERLQVPPQR